MFCKTHKCVVLVYGVLAVAGLSGVRDASAEDKKDNKDKAALAGTWVRKEGELKILFDDKDKMKLFPHGDNKNIAIVLDYTVDKDKRVKVKVTDYQGEKEVIEKVKEHVPTGLEFSFKWTAMDKTAKLDEIKGKEDVIEQLKAHLEGDYERK